MDDDGATPMMAQYLEIKARHPGALLFYRMGDFYETFFEDAEAAAQALDIALTRRGTHRGREVPMAGVPVHAAESYLLALIRKGFRVAVAEQMETPEEARRRGGSKALVRRDVVRVVTPGTLTEESLLEARSANRLAALARHRGEAALAWADISTGDLGVTPLGPGALAAELARLAPREVLAAEDEAAALAPLAVEAGAAVTALPRAAFAGDGRRLAGWLGVATLDAFGAFGRAEAAALGALADYLDLTQKGARPALRPPRREESSDAMALDPATRASLEISRGPSGTREGSLLAAIDRTATAGGGRLLEARLGAPSRRLPDILARQGAVAALAERPDLGRDLRAALRGAPDLDRALGRLALDRGGPRDLAACRDALAVAGRARDLLAGDLGPLLGTTRDRLAPPEGLEGLLARALVERPPTLARDGGLVAPGFSAALDAARRLRDEGRAVIAAMQAEYAQLTGIAALKVRHNGQLGYFVECTATHAGRMLGPPLDATFRHRQTTANLLRFTTAALAETESRLLGAADEALALERGAFEDLRAAVLAAAPTLARLSQALAEADVAAALADLALAEGWTRPHLDASRDLVIEGGRHPVVEAALRRAGQPFVANGCDLSDAPLLLVTGPNMGGKSTFLRQAALIAILAQAGSFVPAVSARIGLVSRVFSRVGAADDLARGRSTFMVEMVETAAILHQADDRALVILDEIGRGTSTWDGLSIAWAVVEHLEDRNRCRALFATHYHELAALAGRLPRAANAHVAVADWEGDVVFLHEVREGAADRSYGVQVARLAGLPARAVARARQVLRALERGRDGAALEDLPLFATAAPEPPRDPSAVEARLAATDPDALSAREALELVYELKRLL